MCLFPLNCISLLTSSRHVFMFHVLFFIFTYSYISYSCTSRSRCESSVRRKIIQCRLRGYVFFLCVSFGHLWGRERSRRQFTTKSNLEQKITNLVNMLLWRSSLWDKNQVTCIYCRYIFNRFYKTSSEKFEIVIFYFTWVLHDSAVLY